MRRKARGLVGLCVMGLAVWGAPSCASVEFRRNTETSGTFTSKAFSFTFLSYDLPGGALEIARGNAADGGLPNTIVEREFIFPYLGLLDFLLDIISVRYVKIEGTWGFPPDRAAGEAATR